MLTEHAHHEFAPAVDVELAVDALEMSVHGVGRDPEPAGDSGLDVVVEHTLDDLELAGGKPERA